ncbi:MAG: 5-aminolevulic acid synthase [Pseudomonadota bacterium]
MTGGRNVQSIWAGLLLAFAGMVAGVMPALAQELPGRRDALRLIYPADADVESVVTPHPSLSEGQVALLSTAISEGLMPQMVFYGALAIAPDNGLADPQTTVAVGNFHDEASASADALARCDAARAADATPCVIVLVVRPAGWAPGAALQMSSGAAAALQTEFRQADQPRYFAISYATGRFGIGPSAETAQAACGQADCQAVVADR